MKAEIYSVVDKSFNPKSLDKKMTGVTNRLREADIEILYKTDLEADKIKLLEALRQSYATDEGIQLIIIANALDGTAECDTVQLFKKLCPKHTEADDPDEAENISEYKNKGDLENLSKEYKGKKKKSGKNKSKTDDTVKKGHIINEIWSTGDLGKGYEGCFMLYDEKLVVALPKESLTKTPTSEMIITGAKKATSAKGITTGNLIGGNAGDHFDLYTIAQNNYKKKKKGGFVSNFIPVKGDSALEVTRKIILMAATVTFIVTAVILCKLLFVEPAQVEEKYNAVRDIAHGVKVNSDKSSSDSEEEDLDRFAKLQAINPEIKGWIYIPNTTYIDYPVLEHKGDGPYSQFYLWRDYLGGQSNYGSIFMDYRCEDSINSKNIILHGHNMDNGMVFHQLLSYSNLNFYLSAPIIQFDTAEYDADWKIISVFKTNTLPSQGEFFNYLRGTFENDVDFMDFVYNIMERSIIDTGVTVNENDQLITLSTCSYEFSEFRTVIVARRVRKGEDSKIDSSKAGYNPDAVWPQCWYARNGGVRKELTDFITACKAGQTPWYDGDYKLDKKDIRKIKDSDTEEEKEEE
ncbi:MAG: class B sortase [Clostridia bacterium]|nr:class B sortase [Clostridia bacterium]